MNIFKNGKKIALAATLLLGGAIGMPAIAADNPMEEVGIAHNLYLECLSLSKNQEVSPLRRLVEDCGYDPGMSTDDFVKRYESVVNTDPTTTLAVRLESSTIAYSDYERSFFYRIDEVVASANSMDEAMTRFATLEQEAIANLSVRTEGGRSVLATFSTLRHSIDYWSRVIGETEDSSARLPKWVKKLIVSVVDAYVTGELGPGLGGAASEVASFLLDLIFKKHR
ncbi:MAG: hypothetical protein E6Q88_04925 [Lysobacteraceae bacterium]|nr:MAG: hypothetical protein E6Q88_04925 [Xanthomonadaceae bacterium]